MYSQLADAAAAAGRPDEAAELKTYIEPVFSGTIIYRTLIRLDELPEETKNQPVFNKHGMLLVSLLVDLGKTARWDLQTLRSQFAFSKRFDGFKSR